MWDTDLNASEVDDGELEAADGETVGLDIPRTLDEAKAGQ